MHLQLLTCLLLQLLYFFASDAESAAFTSVCAVTVPIAVVFACICAVFSDILLNLVSHYIFYLYCII